jgi:hypothetical protein
MRKVEPPKTPAVQSFSAGTKPGSTIASKGKCKAKAFANPDSGPDDSDESDDDVHKNGFDMANGIGNGSRGKGKAKASVVDGFVDTEEEDLYS